MKKRFRIIMAIILGVFILISNVAINQTVIDAATIKINKQKLSLTVGDTYTLKISGSTGTVKWASSKKSIATVSSVGKVTGIKKGTSTITATVNNKKYTCKVTVKDKIETGVLLRKGEYVQLKLIGADSLATWKSSDKSIASVNKIGYVQGLKEGLVDITAIYDDITYIFKIQVMKAGVITPTPTPTPLPTPTPTPLPITNTLELPTLPLIISEYDYRGVIKSSVEFKDIAYKFKKNYNNTLDLEVTITGDKIYDYLNNGSGSSTYFYYKLYKDDFVVKSLLKGTSKLEIGEKFNNLSTTFYGLEPGNYVLKIVEDK